MTRTRQAEPGTAAARRRDRTAPFLDRPVDLLRVDSALCPGSAPVGCPHAA